MMKKLILIATIGLAIVSCNKNQKAVKTLDGEWKATGYSYKDGTETQTKLDEGEAYTYSFDDCKLKDDEYCNLKITYKNGTVSTTTSKVYRVTNDGKSLEVKDNKTATLLEEVTVVDLDKKTLKLKYIDGTEIEEFTFTKQ